MPALAAQRERDAVAGRIVFGDDAAGVEIIGDETLVDQGERRGVRRLGECRAGGGGVAERRLEGDIAGAARPDQRRVLLHRRRGADHGRQRLPVDGDRLGGILRLLDRLGDDECNGVADMARRLARQYPIRRRGERLVGNAGLARQWTELGNVGGGQHEMHTGRRARVCRVGDTKACMRMGRAQDDGVQYAGRCVIGHVAAAAAQQRIVFLARDRLADAEFHLIQPDAAPVRPGAGSSARQSSCRPHRTPA